LILIPTSSGTGSEVTVMGVIYDKDTDAKEFVLKHADLAILDPELTASVPPQVTAATGMDAMSHAVEAYTSNCGNPKSDILALEAIRLIADNIETAYNDGNNMEARKNLSLASNYAGMAFSDSSVHFGHAAGHEFGIRFDMPHGIACAIALPEVITFSAETIPEKTKNIARALGIDVPEKASGTEAGEWAAERVRMMMKTIGIKSLKEQGLSRDAVISCALGAIEKNWFVICAVKPVDNSVMAKEMGKMYDNYQ
jgi:alcohol dehydrogenase class IV